MLEEIFYDVDNFCKVFERCWEKRLIETGTIKKVKKPRLIMSEIMTIIIYFHFSKHRTFKDYYIKLICGYLHSAFPNLVSYNRFVELSQGVLVPLMFYLQTQRLGQVTGISFVDSTTIKVCHNRRIPSHKVFKGIAQRGKSSVGWFYGFKLHIVVNDKGELLSFTITRGNVDDRNQDVMDTLTKGLFGKLFGDKGYISQHLLEDLLQRGVELVTKIKKNMKNKLIPLLDKILLRKRSLIETVNDELKNICQIEHTRHRSLANFLVNMISGLIAYTYLPKKPSLNLYWYDQNMPMVAF